MRQKYDEGRENILPFFPCAYATQVLGGDAETRHFLGGICKNAVQMRPSLGPKTKKNIVQNMMGKQSQTTFLTNCIIKEMYGGNVCTLLYTFRKGKTYSIFPSLLQV